MVEIKKDRWWLIILIILGSIFLISFVIVIISNAIGTGSEGGFGENVALIEIKGVITGDGGGDLFSSGQSSQDIVKLIKKADDNKFIKAIIFEINSPGGSAVASDEIAQAIKVTDKLTVAWIREVGASGGYWVASATDHIVANRMSITGSIGVISSYLDFSGFLGDHNITYVRMVSGKYKDLGSPFKELTSIEQEIFQSKIDKIREYFIEEVAINRNLALEDVSELATGLFYLGSEALELGLVDEMGGLNEVKDYISTEIGEDVDIVKIKKEVSFFDLFSTSISKFPLSLGEGIGKGIVSKDESLGINV